jgi:hypothetical protein
MEIGAIDDDECALVLDLLVHFRENVAKFYDPEDQERFIDAANRFAARLHCVYEPPFVFAPN